MKIYSQNALDKWPFEDNSIQVIITSPPYWALRKYHIPDVLVGGNKDCTHEFSIIHRPLRDTSGMPSDKSILAVKQIEGVESTRNIFYSVCKKCGCWQGQYGIEPTFIGEHSYMAHTKLWMQEATRCLREDGILFINVSDSYYSGGKGTKVKNSEYKNKCKCLIPERIAIMAVDELGLIHRNTIIWHKINHMPRSVTDRFTDSYEHILMLVKNQKYQFFLDPIREPHKQVSIDRLKRAISNNNKWVNGASGQTKMGLSQPRENTNIKEDVPNEDLFDNSSKIIVIPENGDTLKGKNPSDFYTEGVDDVFEIATQPLKEKHFAAFPEKLIRRLILCSTKKGDIVLDPFAGSGTSLKVAEELDRIGCGIELGYQDIQNRRLTNIQKELPFE